MAFWHPDKEIDIYKIDSFDVNRSRWSLSTDYKYRLWNDHIFHDTFSIKYNDGQNELVYINVRLGEFNALVYNIEEVIKQSTKMTESFKNKK
jgi:hypothetical protein